jgi:hypothetical protein
VSPGTAVVQWTCNGHPDQTWVVDAVGGGWTTIRNSVNQNMCLGVYARGTFDGANLVVWNCNGSPDQEWWLNGDLKAEDYQGTITDWFNGCYAIINYNASSPPGVVWVSEPAQFLPKLIGVWGGATNDGAQTVVWDATNAQDQYWC